MKKNIINLLLLTLFFVSCNKDNPHYSEISLSDEAVTLDVNETIPVSIVQGNGNYVAKSRDTQIAQVKIEDNTVLIQGVSPGKTTIEVSDWAKKRVSLEIAVNYIPTSELILDHESGEVDVDGFISFSVFQGNGVTHLDYEVSSSDEQVAIISKITADYIELQGVGAGEATITVTDKEGLSAAYRLKVNAKLRELALDVEDVVFFHYEKEGAVINILDGNGDYEVSTKDNSITATLDGAKITIEGTKEVSTTLTVTDSRGLSKEITVVSFGDFLASKQTRAFYARSFINRRYSKAVTETQTTGRSTIKISDNASLNRGEVLSFPGDLTTLGKRSDPKFHTVGFFSIETHYNVSDLEIVKVEDRTLWVTFICEGEPAYLVYNI